jgi:hypothetical protein
MNKFIVETYLDETQLGIVLAKGVISAESIVTPYQDTVVPMVDTGVLMSPAEIAKCNQVDEIYFRIAPESSLIYSYSNNAYKLFAGQRVDISKHKNPREFYKDIKTEIDWSVVKEGDLIIIYNTDDSTSVGFYNIDGIGRYISPARVCKLNRNKYYIIDEHVISVTVLKIPGDNK